MQEVSRGRVCDTHTLIWAAPHLELYGTLAHLKDLICAHRIAKLAHAAPHLNDPICAAHLNDLICCGGVKSLLPAKVKRCSEWHSSRAMTIRSSLCLLADTELTPIFRRVTISPVASTPEHLWAHTVCPFTGPGQIHLRTHKVSPFNAGLILDPSLSSPGTTSRKPKRHPSLVGDQAKPSPSSL